MLIPAAHLQLLGDQVVRRGGIGNAQQCLGQAQQRNAFLVRQSELLEEQIEHVALRLAPLDDACALCGGQTHGA